MGIPLGAQKNLNMRISTLVIPLWIFLISVIGCQEKISQSTKSSSNEIAATQKATIALISPGQLEVVMNEGDIQLIDVRTEKEWQQGHLKNAQNFEINNPSWDLQTSTLDKTKPVYVYCAKGGRSKRSAKQLKKAGFTTIYDLDGGIRAWLSEGKAIE